MLRNKKGQGLVEMALVLPILLLLLLGIMEGGLLFASKLEVQNAAREGARMLSLGEDKDDVIANMQSGFVLVDSEDADIKVIPPDGLESGDPALPDSKSVRVKVKYIHTPLTGFIFKNGIDLTTSVTMRAE